MFYTKKHICEKKLISNTLNHEIFTVTCGTNHCDVNTLYNFEAPK